jgi:hypothetical protein
MTSSVNVVLTNNSNKSHNNNKKKNKQENPTKTKQTINLRRIKKIALSTTILVISPVNVRTVSGRAIKNQQIWLLTKL